MKKTHIFYPQNDLALASGQPGFVAPRAAVSLMLSGAALPIWYGDPGDKFIGAVNDQWYSEIQRLFNTRVDVFDGDGTSSLPAPWGWSPASCHFLAASGFDATSLPDQTWLERFRAMSSRVAAAEVARALYFVDRHGITEPARVVNNTAELLECIDTWGCVVAKSPWSCSGRGIIDNSRLDNDEFVRRVEGWFTKYGAFTVEKRHEKVMDFAMLFDLADKASFVGYSWFVTDDHGAYKENILAPDDEIEAEITKYISPQLLHAVTRRLCALLGDYYRDFPIGPIGVDMMVVLEDGEYKLDPYIEINLRRTMGHVANTLVKRYMAPGTRGRYSVLPAPGGCSRGTIDCVVRDHRLVSGTLSLTPPGGAFDFIVTLD